jgi:hypothetical protein
MNNIELFKRLINTRKKCQEKMVEIDKNFILSVHGIKDKETYEAVRNTFWGHDRFESIIVSSDGKGPYWFKDAEQTQAEAERQFRELLQEIVKDGNMYWGNGWFYAGVDPVCDFEVLKNRLVIPNNILKKTLGIQ